MVRIITDSTCDIPKNEWEMLGITVMPLTVYFGDTAYRDGIDLTNRKFFDLLEASEELPTTSQINPTAFEAVFKEAVDAGDDVVGIFISKELSGTCRSAESAALTVDPDKVFVVDSRIGTFGAAIIIREAVKMRNSGMSAREMARELEKLSKRVRLVAMVDTLKFLRKGGRISAATAVVGGLLGIKPMVEVVNGKIESAGKARGIKAALAFIEKYMKDHPIDFNHIFAIGHSNNDNLIDTFKEYFKYKLPVAKAVIGDIGSVIGTYIGPGAFGIAYFERG